MFLNYKEKTSNNGMNATTFIALTPKNENLMELKVSWLICLVRCAYKLLANTLTNRLKEVMCFSSRAFCERKTDLRQGVDCQWGYSLQREIKKKKGIIFQCWYEKSLWSCWEEFHWIYASQNGIWKEFEDIDKEVFIHNFLFQY